MTKGEQDKLILEALDTVVKLARAFYPESKQFSMAWIAANEEKGEYLTINNPYYKESVTEKKLDISRRGDEIRNDFV